MFTMPVASPFYHGSQGAGAAVRWDKWKLFLDPTLTLYDLEADPGQTTPVRNGRIMRKLRGMVVLFQEEMMLDAREPGFVPNGVHRRSSPVICIALSRRQQQVDCRVGAEDARVVCGPAPLTKGYSLPNQTGLHQAISSSSRITRT